MDGADWGLVGGIAGAVFGGLGAWFGARNSYLSAVNEAQRRFYRRLFMGLAPVVLLFISLVFLTAHQILPHWMYWGVMLLWFGALGPFIIWTNNRLATLANEESEAG